MTPETCRKIMTFDLKIALKGPVHFVCYRKISKQCIKKNNNHLNCRLKFSELLKHFYSFSKKFKLIGTNLNINLRIFWH